MYSKCHYTAQTKYYFWWCYVGENESQKAQRNTFWFKHWTTKRTGRYLLISATHLTGGVFLKELIFWSYIRHFKILTGVRNAVLEIQFQSVNYMLLARICKNFKQNKPSWPWCSRRAQYITGFKVNKTIWI